MTRIFHMRWQVATATGLTLTGLLSAAELPSLRQTLLDAPQTSALGGDTTRVVESRDAFSFLAANAPVEHQRPFSFGNRLFNTNWTEAPGSVKSFDGLGPMFNRVSCAGCHTKDGRAAAPVESKCPSDGFLLRVSLPGTSAVGGPLPHPVYGDQISERATGKIAPEACVKVSYAARVGQYGDGSPYHLRVPTYTIADVAYGTLSQDIMMSPRVAPTVIGLGLLQAVDAIDLSQLADPLDADGDGISGRANMVFDATTKHSVPGRFGWKANQPNLRQQNAGAANGDMGLTTSLFATQNCTLGQADCAAAIAGGEPEISDEFLRKLTLYTMTLAVPAQRNSESADVRHGAKLFREFGCAACHMPTLKTRMVDGFPELSSQTIHPFTDLLLHDMGTELADGRPDFEATGSEWRTAPLWGVGLYPVVNGHNDLLHDGRARGMDEAILWHGGEGEASREAFRLAPKPDREALVAFLNSL
jgi:CxxC motif-containing protein (DUF1111 family)